MLEIDLLNPPEGVTSCLDCSEFSEARDDNAIPTQFALIHEGHRLIRRMQPLGVVSQAEIAEQSFYDATLIWVNGGCPTSGEQFETLKDAAQEVVLSAQRVRRVA